MKWFRISKERDRERGRRLFDRLIIFDYFRAISCLVIFFLHATCETGSSRDHWVFFPFFTNALPMVAFFFTTGYLISLSLDSDNGWKGFFIKRFFRLVPVLFVSQIICLFTIRTISLQDFVLNTFMITDLFYIKENAWEHALIFTSWSLWVEVKFYFISCLCHSIFGKNKRLVCYSQIFVATLVVLLCVFFKIPWFECGSLCNCSISVFIVFSGMLVFFHERKYIRTIEFVTLYAISIAMICASFCLFHIKSTINLFFCCAACVVTVIFYLLKNKVSDNKYIKCMANMSYSFYLLHPMTLAWASRYWNPSADNTWLAFWQTVGHRCVFAILTLCICYVIYNKIEKPAYDFGRKLAKQTRRRKNENK